VSFVVGLKVLEKFLERYESLGSRKSSATAVIIPKVSPLITHPRVSFSTLGGSSWKTSIKPKSLFAFLRKC